MQCLCHISWGHGQPLGRLSEDKALFLGLLKHNIGLRKLLHFISLSFTFVLWNITYLCRVNISIISNEFIVYVFIFIYPPYALSLPVGLLQEQRKFPLSRWALGIFLFWHDIMQKKKKNWIEHTVQYTNVLCKKAELHACFRVIEQGSSSKEAVHSGGFILLMGYCYFFSPSPQWHHMHNGW